MKISRLKSKLNLLYTHFIAPPKEWQLPKKAEVLIYDACGAEFLMPYLKKHCVTTMSVNGEVINVPCLLRSMLKIEFWQGKLHTAYTDAYIHVVSPKVIVTFIDNTPAFYTISNRFVDIKTIFVQNGIRGESVFVLEHLIRSKNFHVDYMCVFGAAIGKKYSNYLSGQYIQIGSLKNNAVSKLNTVVSDTVLFLSQWHDKPKDGTAFYINYDGTPISWELFFAAEVKALKCIDRWCFENKKHLKICGRGEDSAGPEIQFFSSCLKDSLWDYIPKIDNFSSYKLIDAAELVVFIDSTLGYESLARGKRTAALTCRGSAILSAGANFGWPADLPNNGPFWSNDCDENEFQRVMNYLNSVSDEEWEQTRKHFASDLMVLDPGNTRFKSLIDNLLSKKGEKNYAD